jgi:hypothetical protein
LFYKHIEVNKTLKVNLNKKNARRARYSGEIMNDEFEYDIFLSFSSADEGEAKKIWQDLSASGLRVFWSDETLKKKIGESFFKVIQHNLENSNHFVLLWTPKSMKSKWVQLEYEAFFQHCHLADEQSRRFIIYKGNDSNQTSLPFLLKGIQTTQSVKEIIHRTGGFNIHELVTENRNLKKQNNELKQTVEKMQQQFSDKNGKWYEDNDDELLIDMNLSTMDRFMEGVAENTKVFLKVFSENNGIGKIEKLLEATQHTEYQSLSGILGGITKRARNLIYEKAIDGYLLGWEEDNSEYNGYYYVTPLTLHSLRQYFNS